MGDNAPLISRERYPTVGVSGEEFAQINQFKRHRWHRLRSEVHVAIEQFGNRAEELGRFENFDADDIPVRIQFHVDPGATSTPLASVLS